MSKYNREGAIGAMLDEYERAIDELIKILEGMSNEKYVKIADLTTKDPDCMSVQTILNHVVRSGYGYANYLRVLFKMLYIELQEKYEVKNPMEAIDNLRDMFSYTDSTLNEKWFMTDDELESGVIITRWGQPYNIEQMIEHAIVHILRHRRQIERFLKNMR